jgi:hypothetical protein
MKFIIAILMMMFSFINASGLEIKEYKADIVKYIKSDPNNKETLSYSKGSLPPGPSCLTITQTGLIYVYDTWNSRFAIFDLSINFLNEVKLQDTGMYNITEEFIKVDENENVFILTTDNNLYKYDKQGVLVYKKNYNTWFGAYDQSENFFPIDNKVFYYDKKKNIRAIDEQGNTLDEAKSLEAFNSIQSSKISKSQPTIQETTIKKYMDEKKLIYKDGKPFISDFDVVKKFYDFKQKSGFVNSTRGTSTPTDWKAYKINNFIGYDKDNNSYWTGEYDKIKVIIIISPDGNLCDFFRNRISYSGIGIGLAPSGDLYYMSLGDGGVSFYKITRRW